MVCLQDDTGEEKHSKDTLNIMWPQGNSTITTNATREASVVELMFNMLKVLDQSQHHKKLKKYIMARYSGPHL